MRTTLAALALLMLAGCTTTGIPTAPALAIRAQCESTTEISAAITGMSREQTVAEIATAGGVLAEHTRAADTGLLWDSLTITTQDTPVRIHAVLSDGTELTKSIDCTREN